MQPLNAFEIHRMHSLFCALAHSEVRMDLGGSVEAIWFQWLRAGFTEDDLRLVITAIERGIRQNRRNAGALRFEHLIENLIKFGSELGQAKQEQRAYDAQKRKPTMDAGKASVLRATGRETEKETEAKSAEQIMADDKALVAFREWKKANL